LSLGSTASLPCFYCLASTWRISVTMMLSQAISSSRPQRRLVAYICAFGLQPAYETIVSIHMIYTLASIPITLNFSSGSSHLSFGLKSIEITGAIEEGKFGVVRLFRFGSHAFKNPTQCDNCVICGVSLLIFSLSHLFFSTATVAKFLV
jgi:hypothetical protein